MGNDFRAWAVALLQGFDLALNEVQFAGEGLDNKHYLVLHGKSPAIRVQEHVDSFTLYKPKRKCEGIWSSLEKPISSLSSALA